MPPGLLSPLFSAAPQRLRRATWLAAASCAVLLALAPTRVRAQALAAAATAEQQVKAAYLFKFIQYVDWPPQAFAQPDSPLVIGVAGADTVADELGGIVASRAAGGRAVRVRRLARGEAPGVVHLLFIGGNDTRRAGELMVALHGQPALVVTESSETFALGAAINFVVVDDKLRFDIAPRAAEQASLKLSARLLGVAHKVIPPAP